MIYKHWEPIKAFLLSLWESIKTTAISVWGSINDFFASLWESVKSIFVAGWEFIKTIFSFSPLGLIIENWGGIADFFSGLWGGIKEQIAAFVDWVWKFSGLDKIFEAVKAVKDFFSDDDEAAAEAPATPSLGHRKGVSPLIIPPAGAGSAEVVVRFDNMPRGAQVSPANTSGGIDLGLETSYALPAGVR
jgi:hypothetical protein